MRYMLIMRPTQEAEEASKDVPFDEIITTMGRYNDELIAAGVMVSGEGLAPPEDGGFVRRLRLRPARGHRRRLRREGGTVRRLLDARGRVQRGSGRVGGKCPLGPGVKLEMRRVPTIDEFPQDNEYVQKEKAWRAEHEKQPIAD